MVAALTTADLLTQVKVLAQLPAADGRITDAELLSSCADPVLRETVADLLIGTRYQHWVVAASDATISSGTYLYDLPARAHASGLTDVIITDGTSEWSAPEIPIAEAYRFRTEHGGWESPFAYTWRDDQLELLPHPTQSGYSLRLLFPRRPSRLVTVSECAVVASLTSTRIVLGGTGYVGPGWSDTQTVDVVRGTSGRVLTEDRATTLSGLVNLDLVSGTWNTSGADAIVAGDFACEAGQTCVPYLPEAVWGVLVAGTTIEALRAVGDDPQAMQDAERRLDKAEARATSQLSPRSRGASKKIIARTAPIRGGR